MSNPSRVIPALLTSTSTGPWCSSTAVNARSTASASVTSHATPNSPSGAPLPRWVTATASPCAANARAIASPIPRLPPVTSTDLPPDPATRHSPARRRPAHEPSRWPEVTPGGGGSRGPGSSPPRAGDLHPAGARRARLGAVGRRRHLGDHVERPQGPPAVGPLRRRADRRLRDGLRVGLSPLRLDV